jgi:hypothetical protein
MVSTMSTKPFTATAANGKVLLDGPGVAETLDQREAREIADELHAAAGEARRQELGVDPGL